ncbi:hypothetical protein Ccar_04360 [Clostridium carboxidivorans P7]|uniref:ABC transporter permease n=1 Tax=Clostridium carboxidivorans P7 TaxID=536227 RepID=C6PX02_9CLOT|nr:hypothetical protein [Clostridium carboxidivorans]AKN30097.1 hypothetical protein Ccar_04360 [Clostridium carboxidivorans P7]EET86239.1 conserved hypothetical protein [Clostridium carboxidivorans P7]EFG86444.1 hypothetical protein CLCAR_3909 [Clostridium carboxidivorans P7]
MNLFSYLIVELNRIFHLKNVYVVILLIIFSPAIGFTLKEALHNQVPSQNFIMNFYTSTILVSGSLFSLLTFIEFHHINKENIRALTDNIISPLILNLVRIVAIEVIATSSVIITGLIYIPYFVMKMEYSFDAYTYFKNFFLFIPFSTLLSILASFAFYQILHRTLKKYMVFF